MLAHFQELKGQMNKQREKERTKLTKLTLESNAMISELSRIADLVLVRSQNFVLQRFSVYFHSQKFLLVYTARKLLCTLLQWRR